MTPNPNTSTRPSLWPWVYVIAIVYYLYTWQSNQEVEEEIAMGRRRLAQRKGATKKELKATKTDVISGMFFSNLVMYFIILSTANVAVAHHVDDQQSQDYGKSRELAGVEHSRVDHNGSDLCGC